ncbi:ABC-F family ATP-binding cassette domain-containing protein [Hydrogenophaga sp.]|uniref:ABC-F family ATP-binding cassette domain-containing protein n=1 Tax=Hydrogenophaga sp. TaxID=1904254 RepID=UPI0027302035|nr:ATP-binding cassette domain-containing protein [Hydrogenophaga sp.]MDP2018357.1 ATP-binding cassette domain-containing protein [Hydrogenophaga sp.]
MITLKNLVLRRGVKVLLDNASCTINPGEKVGLVGRNGAGKSSLFGLLNHTLHEDKGDFYVPPQWRMAHAYMALHDAGAHDAPARAQALILGLGFRTDELERPVNSFSGGWRMRLQLARALMCPSELLLLDEPTNHLDLDALVWLEAWLKRYEGTMLVISHDREFLDAVTNVTIHIHTAQLTRYGGNYSRFEDMRAEQMALQQSAYSRQQDKMAHLQKFIDRFKAKASKAKQAQSRVKALERMEKIGPVLADADFTFEFTEPQNLPNPMLAMSDASFGYPPPDEGSEPTVIVRNISRSVLAGQRIGILGANGQGKSTVVKTIARDLQPIAGEITEGKGLNIGYFAQQELDVLRPADTPLEHMIRLVRECTAEGRLSGQPTREQDLRSFLGNFNFTGDQVKQSVGSMSGGEKARLVLCMIVWQRPNLLLLDEPTNHLDLATREALSVALNEFEGTVMLVSHDRALLRAVCDEFWLVSRGGIEPFDGDLDDYQRYLLDMAKQSREAQRQEQRDAQRNPVAAPVAVPEQKAKTAEPNRSPEQKRSDAQRRQQLAEKAKPLKKELEQTEKRMAQLAQEKSRLEASMSLPLSPADLAHNGKQLKAMNDENEALEARWLELTEAIEAINA